jgi:predicted outer membrane repeat protein
MRSIIVGAIMVACIYQPALATTYEVRPDGTGDFATIQEAVYASSDGDIIELTDGHFTGDGNYNIDFDGKAITIRSQSDNPEACRIECSYHGRGFSFNDREGPGSVLAGVSIVAGYGQGGAILCDYSSPTIINCIIIDCAAVNGAGGGVYATRSSITFEDCQFIRNSAVAGGAAQLASPNYDPSFIRCVFYGNVAENDGGAMYLNDINPLITGCTFCGNSAGGDGSAIRWAGQDDLRIQNTIISFGAGGAVIETPGGDVPILSCCDIYGNEGGDWTGNIADQLGAMGNISEDPLFCDHTGGDLTLHEDSPCAPFTPPNEECDLIGALPVACGTTAVRMGTWGSIKAMYR